MDETDIEIKYPMVRLVTHLIDMFDPYGINHSEGVRRLAIPIAKCAGITDKKGLEDIELAALLHDIGKMVLPEFIRSKQGKLTDAEYFLVKQHCRFGYDILNHMNGSISDSVKESVLYHHENMDGSGYPEGLQGNNIPVYSRIIRIADTFDAITHSRGYRHPISNDEAIALMIKDSRFFDPVYFACFLTIVKNNPPKQRYEAE